MLGESGLSEKQQSSPCALVLLFSRCKSAQHAWPAQLRTMLHLQAKHVLSTASTHADQELSSVPANPLTPRLSRHSCILSDTESSTLCKEDPLGHQSQLLQTRQICRPEQQRRHSDCLSCSSEMEHYRAVSKESTCHSLLQLHDAGSLQSNAGISNSLSPQAQQVCVSNRQLQPSRQSSCLSSSSAVKHHRSLSEELSCQSAHQVCEAGSLQHKASTSNSLSLPGQAQLACLDGSDGCTFVFPGLACLRSRSTPGKAAAKQAGGTQLLHLLPADSCEVARDSFTDSESVTAQPSSIFGSPDAIMREPVHPEAVSQEAIGEQSVSPEAVSQEAISEQSASPAPVLSEAVSPEAIGEQSVRPEANSKKSVSPEAVSVRATTLGHVYQEAVSPGVDSIKALCPQAVGVAALSSGPQCSITSDIHSNTSASPAGQCCPSGTDLPITQDPASPMNKHDWPEPRSPHGLTHQAMSLALANDLPIGSAGKESLPSDAASDVPIGCAEQGPKPLDSARSLHALDMGLLQQGSQDRRARLLMSSYVMHGGSLHTDMYVHDA